MEARTGGMALSFSQARACLTLGTILKIQTESLPKSSIPARWPSLAPAEKLLGRRVNPTLYTSDEFRCRRVEKSGFVTRVLEVPHAILMGSLDGACPHLAAQSVHEPVA